MPPSKKTVTWLVVISSMISILAGGLIIASSFHLIQGTIYTTQENTNKEFCTNNCGNGICEKITCYGGKCSCGEDAVTCPQDCTKKEIQRLWVVGAGMLIIIGIIALGTVIFKKKK